MLFMYVVVDGFIRIYNFTMKQFCLVLCIYLLLIVVLYFYIYVHLQVHIFINVCAYRRTIYRLHVYTYRILFFLRLHIICAYLFVCLYVYATVRWVKMSPFCVSICARALFILDFVENTVQQGQLGTVYEKNNRMTCYVLPDIFATTCCTARHSHRKLLQ